MALPLASLARSKEPDLQALLDSGLPIPPGDYTVSETLIIRRDGTHLADVTIRAAQGMRGPVISVQKVRGVKITNCTILGQPNSGIRIGSEPMAVPTDAMIVVEPAGYRWVIA